MKTTHNTTTQKYFLLAALLVGGILRFYNLNWDNGLWFHPDERNIANAVLTVRFFDQLNPNFFAYGGLVIYLYRATGELLARLTSDLGWVSDWGHINLIGRYYSALFSTMTIVPLFVLARRLFNFSIAALATTLYVFCVASIQNAHYSTTESLLTLCVVTLAWLCLRLVERPGPALYLAAAGVQGVALGAKTAALAYYVFLFAAQAVVLFRHRSQGWKYFWKYSALFVAAIALSVMIALLLSPYTLLDWPAFRASMTYESGVVSGTVPVPYTEQFKGKTAYLFPLVNLFWQFGPVAVVCLAGVALLIGKTLRDRSWRVAVLLSFPLVYFLYIGQIHAKFVRYMVPLMPFLALAGGYGAWWLWRRLEARGHAPWGRAVAALTIVLAALWTLAFSAIYVRTPSRIAAARWIYANVPANSKILGEHWDDRMPIVLPNEPVPPYNIEALTIYDKPPPEYYADRLATADYVILASRRLYGTLRWRTTDYPVASQYYRLLFDGELGYEPVAEFTSYPNLFGFDINDDASEETFQVFDHPKILVFQNTGRLSRDEIRRRILAAVAVLSAS